MSPGAENLTLDAAPNPFNPIVSLHYDVPADGFVKLVVHDLRGRVVRRLVGQRKVAGSHRVEWDGRDEHGEKAATGVHFCRLVTPGYERSRKMTLLK